MGMKKGRAFPFFGGICAIFVILIITVAAMELIGRRYPIGIQNFEELRNWNCVYVDKTELVYKLANTGL